MFHQFYVQIKELHGFVHKAEAINWESEEKANELKTINQHFSTTKVQAYCTDNQEENFSAIDETLLKNQKSGWVLNDAHLFMFFFEW